MIGQFCNIESAEFSEYIKSRFGYLPFIDAPHGSFKDRQDLYDYLQDIDRYFSLPEEQRPYYYEHKDKWSSYELTNIQQEGMREGVCWGNLRDLVIEDYVI